MSKKTKHLVVVKKGVTPCNLIVGHANYLLDCLLAAWQSYTADMARKALTPAVFTVLGLFLEHYNKCYSKTIIPIDKRLFWLSG